MTYDYIGYTALAISLISINMTNMRWFRWLHLTSSCVYFVYGWLISAWPLAVGALLFAGIHSFRLYKMTNLNEYQN